jgi:hypothetical protein
MKVELFEKMTNVFTNGPCIGVDLPFEREEIFLHASENELAEAMREYRQDQLPLRQVRFLGSSEDECDALFDAFDASNPDLYPMIYLGEG